MNDFYISPIVGFRSWRIDRQKLTLKALSWSTEWPAGEPMVSTHDSTWSSGNCQPGKPCNHCGIWAFHSYGLAATYRLSKGGDPSLVRGLVIGWGSVNLCDKGWRAGKAYPLALFEWGIPPYEVHDGVDWHYAMYRVARRYNVPIISTPEESDDVINNAGAVTAADYGLDPKTYQVEVTTEPPTPVPESPSAISVGIELVQYTDPANWRIEIHRPTTDFD